MKTYHITLFSNDNMETFRYEEKAESCDKALRQAEAKHVEANLPKADSYSISWYGNEVK